MLTLKEIGFEWIKFLLLSVNILLCTLFFPVSTFTKGEQMVPVLNAVGTTCAVYGNHDFGKWSYFLEIVNDYTTRDHRCVG